MTTTIKTFDPTACGTISGEAVAALQLVAEEYGLTVKRGRGTYDSATFTFKVTFIAQGDNGIPADFAKYAPMFGLVPEDFGAEFTTRHGTFSICGIKPRNRKYPILGKCVKSGKTYKFEDRIVSQITAKRESEAAK